MKLYLSFFNFFHSSLFTFLKRCEIEDILCGGHSSIYVATRLPTYERDLNMTCENENAGKFEDKIPKPNRVKYCLPLNTREDHVPA